jgi:hypothetical protein
LGKNKNILVFDAKKRFMCVKRFWLFIKNKKKLAAKNILM